MVALGSVKDGGVYIFYPPNSFVMYAGKYLVDPE